VPTDPNQNWGVNPEPGAEPGPAGEPQRPERNQADPASIGSGIVFFLIGGAYLLASGGHLSVNAGWTLSALMLGLGLSGVVSALLRGRRGGGRD
jgi:hypothetical protein